MELVLTKEQILELYLNQIYFADKAPYGVASAAQTYFGKDLSAPHDWRISISGWISRNRQTIIRPSRPTIAQKVDRSMYWRGWKRRSSSPRQNVNRLQRRYSISVVLAVNRLRPTFVEYVRQLAGREVWRSDGVQGRPHGLYNVEHGDAEGC